MLIGQAKEVEKKCRVSCPLSEREKIFFATKRTAMSLLHFNQSERGLHHKSMVLWYYTISLRNQIEDLGRGCMNIERRKQAPWWGKIFSHHRVMNLRGERTSSQDRVFQISSKCFDSAYVSTDATRIDKSELPPN